MCTVTLIARKNGYSLGMNRDEQRSRPTAMPPAVCRLNGRNCLFPSEHNGGTWIGVNERGLTLALINWYSVPNRACPSESRGTVIPALLPSSTPIELERTLRQLTLGKLNPFRLITVFGALTRVMEWCWDQEELTRIDHPWRLGGWFSSGFDEPGAQLAREAFLRKSAPTSTDDSLRDLHSSHVPAPGPYSFCMHREDAATVSYTEIIVRGNRIEMNYTPGSPCESRERVKYEIGCGGRI
jgi:hypothetical protein